MPSVTNRRSLSRQPTSSSSSSRYFSRLFDDSAATVFALPVSFAAASPSFASLFGTGAMVNKGMSLTTMAFALMPVLLGFTVHIILTYLRDSIRIKSISKRLTNHVMTIAAANDDSVLALSNVYLDRPVFSKLLMIREPACSAGTESAPYKFINSGQQRTPALKKNREESLNHLTSMYSSGVVNSFIQSLSRYHASTSHESACVFRLFGTGMSRGGNFGLPFSSHAAESMAISNQDTLRRSTNRSISTTNTKM